MFTEYYNQLTETHKGILLMLVGVIILGYQQNWAFLEGLREIIRACMLILSIALIGYGFYKLEGHKKIMNFFEGLGKKG